MVSAKKILFPTDLSANSSKIAPHVLSMAKKYDSAVHVLHVIPNHLIALPYASLDINEPTIFESANKNLGIFCQNNLSSCHNVQVKVAGSGNS